MEKGAPHILQCSGLHGIPCGVPRGTPGLCPGPADSKVLSEVAGRSRHLQCLQRFLSEMLAVPFATETEVSGLGEIAVSRV